VVVCRNVADIDEAIDFTNKNNWGNGCAVFTQSGAMARKYQHEIDVGQVNRYFVCVICSLCF